MGSCSGLLLPMSDIFQATATLPSTQHKQRKSKWKRGSMMSVFAHLFVAVCWLLGSSMYVQKQLLKTEHVEKDEHSDILISYGYFEKDEIQRDNFEYFLKLGTNNQQLQAAHFVFVVSSYKCTPCQAGLPHLLSSQRPGWPDLGVQTYSESGRQTLIFRTENVGMDIASHNVTFEFMRLKGKLWQYRYFFMINSSAKGPFYPAYMPPSWHWTHAFLTRFRGDVHAVASSLVCLPEVDAGGPGPRIESWAYAVDRLGLKAIIAGGALNVRRCKICPDNSGIVVAGEYGIGLALLNSGYNMATLMRRYAEDIDWRDTSNWGCNNNVHPSRHGTYGGIGFHPFETVFVKSSWHVADPYTSRYSAWMAGHAAGDPGTNGTFDYLMYRYAVSAFAQEPNGLEVAYNVSGQMQGWMSDPSYYYF